MHTLSGCHGLFKAEYQKDAKTICALEKYPSIWMDKIALTPWNRASLSDQAIPSDRVRNPIREDSIVHSKFEIRWTGVNSFNYQGEICGKKYSGQLALKL